MHQILTSTVLHVSTKAGSRVATAMDLIFVLFYCLNRFSVTVRIGTAVLSRISVIINLIYEISN